MNSAYFPLTYLFKTKLNNAGKALKYTGFNVGLIILGFYLLPGFNLGLHQLVIIITAWINFSCLYEVTYYINNNISVKKEKNPTTHDNHSQTSDTLIKFILSRIGCFLLLSFWLATLSNISFFKIVSVPLLVFGISFLHNFTYSEKRIIWLGILYLLKIHICFFLLGDFKSPIQMALLLLPAVSVLVLYYFLLKHISGQFHKKFSAPATVLISLGLMLGVIIPLFVQSGAAWSLIYILAVHVLGSFGNAIQKTVGALSPGDNVYHMHTHFSFDSPYTPEELCHALANLSVKNLYVTDHDNGATPESYQQNKQAFEKAAAGGAQNWHYGIEQNINKGNHFLLCGLKEYKRIHSFDELSWYRNQTSQTIWAHPGIYFLFRLSGLIHFFDILKNIDAVEIINLRPKRRFYSHIITFVIGFGISMLALNKRLVVGLDLHTPEELQKMRNNWLFTRLYCR